MNEVDTAWAAGLFEGEGCFSHSGRTASGRYMLVACLYMTDEDTVRRFGDIMEIGSVRFHPRKKGQDMWMWRVCGTEKFKKVYELFEPFLSSRRKTRAKELLALPTTNPNWRNE